jgi:hypothetical protein
VATLYHILQIISNVYLIFRLFFLFFSMAKTLKDLQKTLWVKSSSIPSAGILAKAIPTGRDRVVRAANGPGSRIKSGMTSFPLATSG